jgi:stage II sporulation protein D
MKPIPFLLAVCLTGLSPVTPLFSQSGKLPTDHAQTIKPATIKVLLQDRQDRLLLEVKGRYQLYSPSDNLLLSSGFLAKRDFISHQENGMVWGDLLPGIFQMRIVPADSQTAILINGKQYKGCVEIYDIDGKLRVINEVDIENYLRSSLSSQFTEDLEKEALNAVAIVARTHAYYLVQRSPNAPWHITAEEAQYDGYGVTLQNVALEESISETRHAILKYENQPFASTWSENSAGKTASFSSVFRKNPHTPKGVSLPALEAQRERFVWSFQINKQELAKIAQLPKVSQLSLFSEKGSGKVYAMSIGDGSTNKTISFFDLQKAIGPQKLKSNDFTLQVQDNQIIFKGYGIGNGVGLCLYSARMMAQQGLDAKKILANFFPETQMEKLRNYQDSPQSFEKQESIR